MKFDFNITNPQWHGYVGIETQDAQLINSVPVFRRASLHNALIFGSPLLKQILQTAPIVGDRDYVNVDTFVHSLLPGWYPSNPSWRICAETFDQLGNIDLVEQKRQSDSGYFPRVHSFVLGPSLPEYMSESFEMSVSTNPSDDFARLRTRDYEVHSANSWISYDWWQLHRDFHALETGIRLHVRVTETNVPPSAEDFVRTQSQVYIDLHG